MTGNEKYQLLHYMVRDLFELKLISLIQYCEMDEVMAYRRPRIMRIIEHR